MPGEDIYSWSTTALDNGNADIAINWLEGQARASVNNSARAQMAAHAKARDQLIGAITTAGTANAQTFSSGNSYAAVPNNMRVLLKVGATLTNITGPMTLAMDGLAAVAVKYPGGDDVIAGAFTAGSYVELVYVTGTTPGWVLLNAIPSTPAEATPPTTIIINNTNVVTPVSSVDFTSQLLDDTYNPYIFTFSGVKPEAAEALLYLQMSSDGGTSWLSAPTSYQCVFNYTAAGTGAFLSVGTSAAHIFLTVTLTSAHFSAGTIEIYRRSETIIRSAGLTLFGGLGLYGFNGSGVPNGGVQANAIRFLMSTGNIAAGTFTMSGVRVPTP